MRFTRLICNVYLVINRSCFRYVIADTRLGIGDLGKDQSLVKVNEMGNIYKLLVLTNGVLACFVL